MDKKYSEVFVYHDRKKLRKKRTRAEPRQPAAAANGNNWKDKRSRYPKATIPRPIEERPIFTKPKKRADNTKYSNRKSLLFSEVFTKISIFMIISAHMLCQSFQ